MTTYEVEATPFVAKLRATPAGEGELVSGDADSSVYGPVEIVWYPDRLTITAVGAGAASLIDTCLCGCGQDVVFELRLPGLDELANRLPGAD
jgi:hypothetical protein